MRILSIETSCDETAIAIVSKPDTDAAPTSITIEANIVLSQAKKHAEYGGVFPALAKREHAANLVPVLTEALKQANLLTPGVTNLPDMADMNEREPEMAAALTEFLNNHSAPAIDAVAVTRGPGLEPALWVGINLAKALAEAWNKPIIAVNHMEGHVLSSLLDSADLGQHSLISPELPALALLVSGGHTELVSIPDWGTYEKIGQTKDDAAGEAFDKVARLLDLPYPGGPEVSKLAATGESRDDISLPRPMLTSGDFDFSFSGLKTAVRYLVRDLTEAGTWDDATKTAVALEFEQAVTQVLVKKTIKAAEHVGAASILVAGGVSANRRLRSELEKAAADASLQLVIPPLSLATDNALMIGLAALFNPTPISTEIRAEGNWSIDS